MREFYDARETGDPDSRDRALMGALPRQIAHAKGKAPGWARILSEVDPAAVTGRAALARLPVTRKPDLVALQKAEPPFGGLNATPLAQLGRIFVSPGDRKSTRLNSSHSQISYAVFCLKKKKKTY